MIIKDIKKQIKLSKKGKPYASVLVKFDEYRDNYGKLKWISGFGNQSTWAWKVGMDVYPEITENNGHLNFTFEEERGNELDVYRLPATVGFVMDLLKFQQKQQQNKKEETYYQEENEEVPF